MIGRMPVVYRKNRSRKRYVAPSLMLVSADYTSSNATVLLTFDRAIDVSGYVPSQVRVDDNDDAGYLYEGNGEVTLESANAVRIGLVDIGNSTGPGITMTVAAGNGIVASADGGAWGGVVNLALPFG